MGSTTIEKRSHSSPEIVLTDAQQLTLDCGACFAGRSEQLEASDVAECRGLGINVVRYTLQRLQSLALIENTSPPGKRKNLYNVTPLGLELSGREAEAECLRPPRVPALSPATQKVLDCASCLETNQQSILKSTIADCLGMSPNTVHCGLGQLVDRGYLTGAKVGNTNRYSFAGQPPVPEGGCRSDVATREPLAKPLSPRRQKVRDCIGCQAAQGLIPNSHRTAICTGLNSVQVGRAVDDLTNRNLVRESGTEKPGVRSFGRISTYQVVDVRTFGAVVQPDCTIDEKVVKATYERLTSNRKAMLGCLACIQSKIEQGVVLPGASAGLLNRCKGWELSRIYEAMEAFCDAGYYTRKEGFSPSALGTVFFQPTRLGRLLLDYSSQQAPLVECNTNFAPIVEAPLHIRDETIKCVGCIWTQQVASGHKPEASAQMISRCRGLDRSHLTSVILPNMAKEGYFSRLPTSHSRDRIRYAPNNGLRIPLGLAVGCNFSLLSDQDIGSLMDALPEDLFGPNEADDSLAGFEAFVSNLRSTSPPEADLQLTDSAQYFRALIKLYPLLTAEEEAHLSLTIQTSADRALAERSMATLVYSNIRLAHWMSRKMAFASAVTSFEETFQAALAGVIEASKNFDSKYGTKFSVLAYLRMRTAIQTTVAERYGVPVGHVTRIPRMLWCIYHFYDTHQREPNILELSTAAGMSPNLTRQVVKTYIAITQKPLLLDDDNERRSPHDSVADMNILSVEVSSLFNKAMDHLDAIEKAMLEHVLVRNAVSLEEFAERSALSQEDAHTRFTVLLSKLKHPFFGYGPALDSAKLAWQAEAQCVRDDLSRIVQTTEVDRRIKSTCLNCPVIQECDDYASSKKNKIITGVWGGKLRTIR